MKILLAAINSKYNHTNIAVRCLSLYAKERVPEADIVFDEWTINMSQGEILRGIADHNPDMILFSSYIWNAEMLHKIIPDIKKILPMAILGAGGPEFGFAAKQYMEKFPQLDFIIYGEGEETFTQICQAYMEAGSNSTFKKIIPCIKGIFYRSTEIFFTGERELICNLDSIPFPYPQITEPDTKIHYYESSRGCPFSCSYCMSSLDKRVRFLSTERVYSDLQKFLDAGTSLVKFVDRTYNLNQDRYLGIWQYILDHHNGKTMFHFEIEAEFLSPKALEFMQKVPEGVMQFEIGIQSANTDTLKSVGRSQETVKLAQNIKAIPKNIHKHLDLIAGLPYENLESFGKSFDFVMSLKPDELQLGFLKVLHGTIMEKYAKQNGWQWMENPPYETFSTPYMSYDDINFLKDLEIINDVFYNSETFRFTMNSLCRNGNWWQIISKLTDLARKDRSLASPKKPSYWFNWIAEYLISNNDSDSLECLKFDFLRQGKNSSYPEWLEHNYTKEKHLQAMNQVEKNFTNRIEFAFSDYDEFSFNPMENPDKTCKNNKGTCRMLFIYKRPNSSIKNFQIILQ